MLRGPMAPQPRKPPVDLQTIRPTPPRSRTHPPSPQNPAWESEIEELRDLLLSQAQQLQTQSDQLKQQQEKMQMLEEQLKAGSSFPPS